MTPENWWRVRPLSDGVTWIDEPHIHEFYRCNVWHIRGRDSDMLVDSGMGVVSLRQHIPLVTERPLQAVASHTHFDHIGNHHEFDCRLCHAAEAHMMRTPDRKQILADPYVTDDIFITTPPDSPELGPYQSATYTVAPAPATRLLWDGDMIDLGDRQFEVIHTPGHSPGGIALWEAATGILFSGDITYDGPLIEDTYHSNSRDYFASMISLYHLPVRVVHGGHFPSYDGARHKAMIRKWLDDKEKA